MSVDFVRYAEHSAPLTGRLVECYREVFADTPWNEWLKCEKCDKYWGLKDKAMLESRGFRHCGQPLVDFWSVEQVLTDLEHEITPEASCWLAMEADLVVGFSWGYPVGLADLEA